MFTLSPLRTMALIGLGIAAPYIWVESMFPWSWYVLSPLLKGLWSSFGVKGSWIVTMSEVAHSVVVGVLFGLALRGIGGRAWLKASAIFCITFLISLIGGSFLDTSTSPEWDLHRELDLTLAILGQ